MSAAPEISCLTIFLNPGRFFETALESVLAQGSTDWELLLVDDGSTDGSTEIAKEYAARQPDRIRYFEHPDHANRGMSASRNLGIRHARAPLLSYLDADDVWRPEKLAEQLALIQAHPEVAMVYGPLEIWRSWTGKDGARDELQLLGVPQDQVIVPPDLLCRFLENDSHFPSGALFRRAAIESVGGYEEEFRDNFEDVIVHCKLCLRYPVYASSRSWYRYRQHPAQNETLTLQSGQMPTARRRSPEWFENYLLKSGQARGRVWRTLQAQLRTHRNPKWHAALERVRDWRRRPRMLAGRLRRQLAARVTPSALVLCYHRVTELERDPFQLAVSPAHFAEQLEGLRQHARIVRFSELLEGKPGVALTFDDGYADNLREARPILERFEVPALVYVATGQTGSDREFWWDELERRLFSKPLPEDLVLEIGGRCFQWKLLTEAEASSQAANYVDRISRTQLFEDLHKLLLPLPPDAQRMALDGLPDIPRRTTHLCMTAEELTTLAQGGLVELGAHTVTHRCLAHAPPEEQCREMEGSKASLEKLLARPVLDFSYPYGMTSAQSPEIARAAGFRSAVTTEERLIARKIEKRNRWMLPRFIVRDWNGDELAAKLREWQLG